MKNGETVSVIVINYNYGAFIGQAIESILNQTYQNFEIIVVDDGSTDNSRAVVESLIKKHPGRITYHFQTNQGVGSARNAGLSLARGEWIAFLDADDMWLPEKLEHQISVFKRLPEIGFCCSDYWNMLAGTEASHFMALREMKDFQYDQLLTKNYILGKLLKGNFVGTFTTVFRKSVVEKVGTFKPELRQCEDYDYWLRCAMVTPVYVSSKPLVKRRIHSSNLTNNFLICSQFHEQVLISFYAKNRAFLMEQGLAPDVKAGLARVNYMVGNLQFEQGQTAAAFRTYLRAFKSNPDIHNFGLFTGAVFRKTCRILSLGLISR